MLVFSSANRDVKKTIGHQFQLSFKTKTTDLWYWLIRVDRLEKHLKFICVYLPSSAVLLSIKYL
ncbi:MAG: hypothetical protein EAZ19_14305 [Oscillatoriales cyanobacterium]|nr:MAG: hypothetical protein EAZ86_14435 [Oscillatoriales cyanobacterium]TAF85618.1 MAG: hypothetical protein EAZ49_26030 [Oscillatoriales cyanobacterium]TAG94206.1 MAG: hypothetical protein EAZ19_14305 [Oscillatoriales cyanobacterium]TAH16890.1 MAG: hypothetical protein EAZ10_19795 [Oscillatoriales cyanobacterium]